MYVYPDLTDGNVFSPLVYIDAPHWSYIDYSFPWGKKGMYKQKN